MKLNRLLIAFTVLGLTACGQKGPLYMPDLEKIRNQSSEIKAENSQENQPSEIKDEPVSEPSGS